MFVRIQLETGTTREAILIPREGLVYRGSQPGVYVIEGDRPVFRVIETGLTRGDDVEVLANLDPGVRIVGRGATMLEAGDRISIVESEPESAASRASAETSGASAAGGDAQAETFKELFGLELVYLHGDRSAWNRKMRRLWYWGPRGRDSPSAEGDDKKKRVGRPAE